MAKDCLTEGNIPRCECAICLDNFQEGDNFIKTHCYHYFHRSCLARYAQCFVSKMEKELLESTAPSHVENKEEVIH
jgi:E3 ubiquitin-protein ligase RNF25